MPITAITIENFKCIKEPVRVELKPITLLFGPNSAGKSTIVQALHYAHEIFERQNLNPDKTLLGGESIDLGGFESLVHLHDLGKTIVLRFDLDLTKESLPLYLEGIWEENQWDDSGFQKIPDRVQSAWVEIEVKWSALLDYPLLRRYTVGLNDEKLAEINSSDDGRQINLTNLIYYNSVFLEKLSIEEQKVFREDLAPLLFDEEILNTEGDTEDEKFKKMLGAVFFGKLFDMSNIHNPLALRYQQSALPRWNNPLNFDKDSWIMDINNFEEGEALRQLLSILIVGPGELVRDGLRKFCYVGPLRQVPKRSHRPTTSPEESRWSDGLAAYDTLFFSDETFIEKVNDWLSGEERLNSGYSVEVKKYRELETGNPLMLAVLQGRILDEDIDLSESLLALPVKRRLLIRDEARNIELAPQDIGVGISQVLPVVVAALHHKRGLVAIEQPELHIHPAFQVALGDLFIEQVQEHPDLTFILETHSEHLMLRFLRRIRETIEKEAPENRALTPAEMSIYFIEQREEDISCLPIRVDEDGDFIDRWPHGFFAERAKELF